MERLIDKGIVAACCLTAFLSLPAHAFTMAGLLVALAASALCEALPVPARIALGAAYAACAFAFPEWAAFLPLLAYECLLGAPAWGNVLWAAPLLAALRSWEPVPWLMVALLCAAAGVLARRTASLDAERAHFKALRDSAREASLALEARNRDLQEARDLSAQVATLAERGRIAREIHDNVGHLLTRAIMQVEAFKVVHAEQPQLAGEFDTVAGTLHEAMETVRASVHDLRDDATDPEHLMRSALEGSGIERVYLDFDAGEMPADVSRCFTSIVREASTNTVRHSDATRLDVLVRAYPGLYQLVVQDNGSAPSAALESGSGMGLQAMDDRVRALGGIFSAGWQDGFRVFASVPKSAEPMSPVGQAQQNAAKGKQ